MHNINEYRTDRYLRVSNVYHSITQSVVEDVDIVIDNNYNPEIIEIKNEVMNKTKILMIDKLNIKTNKEMIKINHQKRIEKYYKKIK